MSWPPRVFLSGQAASLLGDGPAVLAIPLLMLGLTRSPLISALSATPVTIGYLVVRLPAGVLVDRFDARRVLVAMDTARMAAFAALIRANFALEVASQAALVAVTGAAGWRAGLRQAGPAGPSGPTAPPGPAR
jgi:MFS family permease